MGKIIRIQHKETQVGVFRSRWENNVNEEFSNGMYTFCIGERHPVPKEDSLLLDGVEAKYGTGDFDNLQFLRYGFADVEQLRNWFYQDDFIRIIAENNFEIVEMHGDVTLGYTQAVINWNTVEKEEKFEILSYLGLTTETK